LIIAIIIAFFAVTRGLTRVYIPFVGNTVDLRWWFIPLCVFTFLATTNSVNLTDGLDGLAAGSCYLFFLAIGIIIAIEINLNGSAYANFLEYRSVAILSFALAGGLVGYLLYNTHKASVFMGDTGSLCLGGFVAIISIVSGNILFIPIIGITFVLSSISVIAQVIYFKRTGKRIFLMSPLHHHFQHKGYEESKIAMGYKLVTLFFALICIISFL
jgi:phospho-N-acetylmuramoyl-pentapeptide-transferase